MSVQAVGHRIAAGQPLLFAEAGRSLSAAGAPQRAEDKTPTATVVVSAPSEWSFSNETCWYARAFIEAIPTDSPLGGRHYWMLSKTTRLACAYRMGCVTEADHKAAVDALEARFTEVLASTQPSRAPRQREFAGLIKDGIGKAAAKTDAEARDDFGKHDHDDWILTMVNPQPTAAGNQAAASQPQAPQGVAWLLDWPGATGQLGMAYRLRTALPDYLLHVNGIGWLYWDGTRWTPDDVGKANRAVYALFKAGWKATKNDPNDTPETIEDKKRLKTTIARCESSAGVESILKLAQKLHGIAATADNLDADPYALNTLDGIVDLRTGDCTPHNPAARHSKIAGVGYDQAADCPRWKTFLDTTFGGKQEMVDYVQRLLGYAAIGEVSRHILPFLHGGGDNGKTVLLAVTKGVLGSYAIIAPANFLLAGRDKHETEIARLCGARLVICSEVNRDSKFDEQKVKDLTGGDGLTGRFMRKDFFDFVPSHTLVLAGNHQPEVSAGGKSFWRRLRLIPFLHEVAPELRNESLTRELIEEEGAAILAWIVEGAQQFIAKGLDDPAVVMTATTEYAESEDHVQLFIDDCCDKRPAAEEIEFAEVYKRYAAWCKDNGIDKLASAVFGRELSGKGFGRARDKAKRYVTGIWVNDPPKTPKTSKDFFDWTDKYET